MLPQKKLIDGNRAVVVGGSAGAALGGAWEEVGAGFGRTGRGKKFIWG